jgi:hypothetical protein
MRRDEMCDIYPLGRRDDGICAEARGWVSVRVLGRKAFRGRVFVDFL